MAGNQGSGIVAITTRKIARVYNSRSFTCNDGQGRWLTYVVKSASTAHREQVSAGGAEEVNGHRQLFSLQQVVSTDCFEKLAKEVPDDAMRRVTNQ